MSNILGSGILDVKTFISAFGYKNEILEDQKYRVKWTINFCN